MKENVYTFVIRLTSLTAFLSGVYLLLLFYWAVTGIGVYNNSTLDLMKSNTFYITMGLLLLYGVIGGNLISFIKNRIGDRIDDFFKSNEGETYLKSVIEKRIEADLADLSKDLYAGTQKVDGYTYKNQTELLNKILDKNYEVGKIFTLTDLYGFTETFKKAYPENKNIESKIRQSIQVLRDLGIVQFISSGKYKRIK